MVGVSKEERDFCKCVCLSIELESIKLKDGIILGALLLDLEFALVGKPLICSVLAVANWK